MNTRLAVWGMGLLLALPAHGQEASARNAERTNTGLRTYVKSNVLYSMADGLHKSVTTDCNGQAYRNNWQEAYSSPFEAGGQVTYVCLSGHRLMEESTCR